MAGILDAIRILFTGVFGSKAERRTNTGVRSYARGGYKSAMQDLAAAAVACSYYIRAAEQGHAAAVGGDYKSANELGLLYVEGKGLEEDLIEGFAWLYVGTHRSIQYEAALKNAMQLAGLLTREQLVVAQTRGQEYYTAYVAKRARR